ncbi:tRNA pseudouridine(38-40) synthase TruA [Robiginitalea sp. M366]|uniref:tRNA pseudouridine(38-40) synthase TruA n=1 Tax=Robiginitalea aestuariiviva TaxID=3036903 RepID=UPI00240E44AB|nr:tRNA pseudouridine(38-40) synthase TruA [Robiginitalea aestuariiviva]MDG1572233.1 tRNA pseudouridine(38-40) synthase TruA [Robiginitalea aestuariiviva]
MRYFIEFSYLGTAYHGWQRQPNALGIQQLMEERLATLLGADHLDLVAAGRTDAGVHARQMFAHFDWDAPLAVDLVHRLNSFLPDDIGIHSLQQVTASAHARFDALGRTYEYLLIQQKDPFWLERAHWVQAPLDFEAMNQAAALMLDFEDFKCFSRSKTDVKTYTCDLREARWDYMDGRWVFTITANRFLRNMVRAVVGTLLLVGRGQLDPEDVKTIIKSRDRRRAGASVPAKGLYLTRIEYPPGIYVNGEGKQR